MKQYSAMFRLLNKYYWKSFFGPFFTFLFPVFWILLIGTIFSLGDQITPALIIPGATMVSIISTSCISLPQTILEFRQTQTLKRIGATKIVPSTFLITVITYYFCLVFISFWLTCGLAILVLWNDLDHVLELFNSANYLELMYSIFITMIMGASLGFLIATFCRTTASVQGIGLFILLISFIFAGVGIPFVLFHDDGAFNISWLWYCSYMDPFHFTSGLALESWWSDQGNFNYYGSSIFNVAYPYQSRVLANFGDHVQIFNTPEKIANIVVPLAIILASNCLTLIFFKLDNNRG